MGNKAAKEFLEAQKIDDCDLQVGNVILLSYPPQVPVKKLSQLLTDFASQSKPQEIPEENRQKLFNHMSTEHGLTLLESEMNSIYSICIGHEEYVKYLNWLHSKPVDTKTVDAVDTTFWRRLEMFVSNIQVNDMAGEEEKQYIIHVIESKK